MNFKKKKQDKYAWGGAIAGLVVGAKIGSGIGIALGPLGAIAGTIPCAAAGLIIGGLAGDKIGSNLDKKDN